MAKHLSMAFGQTTTDLARPNQVKNNSDAYVFNTGMWMHLSRFLILGTEGGSYYVSERALTQQNAANSLSCIKEDGIRAVNEIVAVSTSGRAAKNDYAIFALAMACAFGDVETKRYSFSKLNDVCRIGTHLFQFVDYISKMRGWGRLLTESIANWYLNKTASQVAYQAVKYQSRAIEGQPAWSHNDVLRKCHAKAPEGSEMQQVFRWITEGWTNVQDGNATTQYIKNHSSQTKTNRAERESYSFKIPNSIRILEGYELAKHEKNPNRIAQLIQQYGLTHEMIPTESKTSGIVWEALLEKMPMTAMIRNLGNMSKAGILGPLSVNEKKVVEALLSRENLSKARVHPMQIMSALKIYGAGKGFKGSNTWTVNTSITTALESSFYLSFDYVEPSNKRFFIGQDVSGSMSWGTSMIGSTGLTAAEASCILSMVTIKTEPYLFHGAFSNGLTATGINKYMSLKEVQQVINKIPMSGTDCSLPMSYAEQHNIPVDAFVIYTDNETNSYKTHPFRALQSYRRKMGINSKLIVCGMTATQFTIADPTDVNSLDVVGFDTSTPSVISAFCRD